jgi:hypothetical protein
MPAGFKMAVNRLEDRQKITRILDHLISTKDEIKVLVKGDGNPFNSRIIKSEQNRPSLAKGAKSIIIIEKLQPDRGNNLIQISEKVVLKFLISEQPCTCIVNYVGISSMPHFFGFILSAPEIIEVEEKRREKRVVFEPPDFQLAEIYLRKGTKEERRYELSVIDCASHGLGMIVPEKHIELLGMIKKGDVIKDIHFYAPNAMLKVDGMVKHITRIDEGRFKGGYYIGIESEELMPTGKFTR